MWNHGVWPEKASRDSACETGSGRQVIPVWCPLARIKDSLTNVVSETLQQEYGFTPERVRELRTEVQKGTYRLLLIFEGYDEMQQQHQWKNLYDTNDLEQFRAIGEDYTWPKVILSR